MRGVLVVAALWREIAPFVRELDSVHRSGPLSRGRLHGIPVGVLATGMGGDRVPPLLEPLLRSGAWGAVVSCGFAGGLSPGLPPGTLCRGVRIATPGGESVDIGTPDLPGAVPVTVVTVPSPPDKGILSASLPPTLHPAVVDMESWSLLRVTRTAGIPFHSLRVVSDPLEEPIPFSPDDVAGEDGHPSILRVIRLIIVRPCLLPSLVRLARRTAAGSRRLSHTLPLLVGRIAEGAP